MDVFFSGQLLFAALVLGSAYALIALGLNLVYGTMRLLNIAHGDIIMIGAYISFWLFTLADVSPLISMFIAAGLAALIGAGVYYGLFQRQLGSGLMIERIEANSLLIFFGVSVIIQNVTSFAFTASPRAYQYMDFVYQFGGASMTANRLVTLFVTLVICILVIIFLRTNIYGLAIKALIQNPTAAAIVGVKVKRVQLVSFCLGFGLTGLAGVLVSMTETTQPFMGFPFTIAAFVVIILGGLGNLTGGIVAGYFLGFLQIFGVALSSPTYESVLLYGVFVLILLVRPQGFFGGRRIVR